MVATALASSGVIAPGGGSTSSSNTFAPACSIGTSIFRVSPIRAS